MVPFGRTMGLCRMVVAVEKVRVMRRLEGEEMVMAFASEVWWTGTRMVSCRLIMAC